MHDDALLKLFVQRMQVKNFPKGEFFLPFFLCFTKRRKNSRQGHRRKAEGIAAKGGGNSREAAKDLIGLCEFVVCVCCFEVCRTSKLP